MSVSGGRLVLRSASSCRSLLVGLRGSPSCGLNVAATASSIAGVDRGLPASDAPPTSCPGFQTQHDVKRLRAALPLLRPVQLSSDVRSAHAMWQSPSKHLLAPIHNFARWDVASLDEKLGRFGRRVSADARTNEQPTQGGEGREKFDVFFSGCSWLCMYHVGVAEKLLERDVSCASPPTICVPPYSPPPPLPNSQRAHPNDAKALADTFTDHRRSR